MNNVIDKLLREQASQWELLRDNLHGLNNVEVRSLNFDCFDMKLQFNPARIASSSAKVDKKSLQKRKCFLCSENRPTVQRGIPFNDNYSLLVNPFPIFKRHFTIANLNHTDQLIKDSFVEMLELAKLIDDYTIFYNGPKCGASAPDHMHFQAGEKGFMSIENQIDSIKENHTLKQVRLFNAKVSFINDSLRRIVLIETDSLDNAQSAFAEIYNRQQLLQKDETEPMMNILVSFESGRWRVLLFPRKAHRPTQYFDESDDQILFSPGSVDFGGVCIFPRKQDYEKMNKELLIDIFKQLSVDDYFFNQLME